MGRAVDKETMICLKYGNTNTFYIPGKGGGLLVDTDLAGTLQAFYRALKQNGLGIKDIKYVVATHYHPDHAGLIGELQDKGVRLLLLDVQKDFIHFPDGIFEKDGMRYTPPDQNKAEIISCGDSRRFLEDMGIFGEIIHTPSHSGDSITLILDDGDSFAGDLEPVEFLEAYEDNVGLKSDWDLILSHGPKRIYYAHRPERELNRV